MVSYRVYTDSLKSTVPAGRQFCKSHEPATGKLATHGMRTRSVKINSQDMYPKQGDDQLIFFHTHRSLHIIWH